MVTPCLIEWMKELAHSIYMLSSQLVIESYIDQNSLGHRIKETVKLQLSKAVILR